MRASPESGLPNSFWKLLFLAAFLALFCLLPVIAQKAQGNDASEHPFAQIVEHEPRPERE